MNLAEPKGRMTVLSPAAEAFHRLEPRPTAPRIARLDGARVGFVENGFTSLAILHEEIRRSLEKLGITPVIERKRYWRPLEPAQLDSLVAGTDVVIGGLCNTPPSTAWGVHDAIELERRGVPTVTLATAYYEELLTESAATEGMPDLRRVILPYPLEGRPEPEVRAIARRAVNAILGALTKADAPATVRVTE